MKAYNIYSHGVKLNTKPLTADAIKQIVKNGEFSVKIANDIYKKYITKNVKILECTLV